MQVRCSHRLPTPLPTPYHLLPFVTYLRCSLRLPILPVMPCDTTFCDLCHTCVFKTHSPPLRWWLPLPVPANHRSLLIRFHTAFPTPCWVVVEHRAWVRCSSHTCWVTGGRWCSGVILCGAWYVTCNTVPRSLQVPATTPFTAPARLPLRRSRFYDICGTLGRFPTYDSWTHLPAVGDLRQVFYISPYRWFPCRLRAGITYLAVDWLGLRCSSAMPYPFSPGYELPMVVLAVSRYWSFHALVSCYVRLRLPIYVSITWALFLRFYFCWRAFVAVYTILMPFTNFRLFPLPITFYSLMIPGRSTVHVGYICYHLRSYRSICSLPVDTIYSVYSPITRITLCRLFQVPFAVFGACWLFLIIAFTMMPPHALSTLSYPATAATRATIRLPVCHLGYGCLRDLPAVLLVGFTFYRVTFTYTFYAAPACCLPRLVRTFRVAHYHHRCTLRSALPPPLVLTHYTFAYRLIPGPSAAGTGYRGYRGTPFPPFCRWTFCRWRFHARYTYVSSAGTAAHIPAVSVVDFCSPLCRIPRSTISCCRYILLVTLRYRCTVYRFCSTVPPCHCVLPFSYLPPAFAAVLPVLYRSYVACQIFVTTPRPYGGRSTLPLDLGFCRVLGGYYRACRCIPITHSLPFDTRFWRCRDATYVTRLPDACVTCSAWFTTALPACRSFTAPPFAFACRYHAVGPVRTFISRIRFFCHRGYHHVTVSGSPHLLPTFFGLFCTVWTLRSAFYWFTRPPAISIVVRQDTCSLFWTGVPSAVGWLTMLPFLITTFTEPAPLRPALPQMDRTTVLRFPRVDLRSWNYGSCDFGKRWRAITFSIRIVLPADTATVYRLPNATRTHLPHLWFVPVLPLFRSTFVPVLDSLLPLLLLPFWFSHCWYVYVTFAFPFTHSHIVVRFLRWCLLWTAFYLPTLPLLQVHLRSAVLFPFVPLPFFAGIECLFSRWVTAFCYHSCSAITFLRDILRSFHCVTAFCYLRYILCLLDAAHSPALIFVALLVTVYRLPFCRAALGTRRSFTTVVCVVFLYFGSRFLLPEFTFRLLFRWTDSFCLITFYVRII